VAAQELMDHMADFNDHVESTPSLLDENLPHDLIAGLVGHSVATVQGLGWAGTKNGDLLRRASGVTDAS
jgi:hypothetical protein